MINFDRRQLGHMQDDVDRRFIASEAERLSELVPSQAAISGPEGMKAAVVRGLTTARKAGFREVTHIRPCLDLVVSLGSYFASDPQYEWLRPMLGAESELSANERARLLYWHSTLYLERSYGSDHGHGIAAAFTFGKLDMATLSAVGANYSELAPRLLARLHPQRLPYLSDSAIAGLTNKARELAGSLGLDVQEAAPLLLSLMFSFGYRVFEDPLHPWLSASLSSTSGTDSAAKVAALLSKAQSIVVSLVHATSKV